MFDSSTHKKFTSVSRIDGSICAILFSLANTEICIVYRHIIDRLYS